MNETHLGYLQQCEYIPQKAVGKNAFEWARQVLPADKHRFIDPDLNTVFSRTFLFEYCANKSKSNLNVALAVFARGGMRVDNGRLVFEMSWAVLEPFISKLRNDGFETRLEAYSDFIEKRSSNELPGLGVAFLTKLICFLCPKLKGYNMDQWTVKSINLLFDQTVVSHNGGWVLDANTPKIYESYCSKVEELAGRLGVEPIIAEERILSEGGRYAKWRSYVKKMYLGNASKRKKFEMVTNQFNLYFTQSYWGIHPVDSEIKKIGYIDKFWRLNLSDALLKHIGNWYNQDLKYGNTKGSTREKYYIAFDSATDCLKFLKEHNVMILNPEMLG